jgi:hypothetical protein
LSIRDTERIPVVPCDGPNYVQLSGTIMQELARSPTIDEIPSRSPTPPTFTLSENAAQPTTQSTAAPVMLTSLLPSIQPRNVTSTDAHTTIADTLSAFRAMPHARSTMTTPVSPVHPLAGNTSMQKTDQTNEQATVTITSILKAAEAKQGTNAGEHLLAEEFASVKRQYQQVHFHKVGQIKVNQT